MALWVCRAGKLGEYETKFIEDNSVYCTWDDLDWDMSAFSDREAFKQEVRKTYPGIGTKLLGIWTGQLWAFSHSISTGDLVMLPSKIRPQVIYVGEVLSEYKFSAEADLLYQHTHSVKWLKEISRKELDPDIKHSSQSSLTIFQIKRPNAEARIRKMLKVPVPPTATQQPPPDDSEPEEIEEVDIEDAALQEIADRLIAKYKGHGLAKIVAAILEAKGFTTWVSPPGPDNGVDILASRGSLGFDPPRICVQVKSGDNALERTVLDQLVGAMTNHKADYGMLVSWGGFKSTIQREEANQFFKVRLWTHREIIKEFLQHYEDLPEEIHETIPLKRIWIIDKRAE